MLNFPDRCKQLNHTFFDVLSNSKKITYVKIDSTSGVKKNQRIRFSDIARLAKEILTSNDVSEADKAILSLHFCMLMNRRDESIAKKPIYRRIFNAFLCAILKVNSNLAAIQSMHVHRYKNMPSNQWVETLSTFSTLRDPEKSIDYKINYYCFYVLETLELTYSEITNKKENRSISALMCDLNSSYRNTLTPIWVRRLFSQHCTSEIKDFLPKIIDMLPLLEQQNVLISVLSLLLNKVPKNKTDHFLNHLKNFLTHCDDLFVTYNALKQGEKLFGIISYIHALELMLSSTHFKTKYLAEFYKTISELSEDERLDFVTTCHQFEAACQDPKDPDIIIKILKTYPDLPIKWRASFINHFSSLHNQGLHDKIETDLNIIKTSETLKGLSSWEKEELGEQILPLSKQNDSFIDRIAIVEALYDVFREERKEIIKQTQQVIENNQNQEIHIPQIIKNLYQTYQADRRQQVLLLLTQTLEKNALNPLFSTLFEQVDLESDTYITTLMDALIGIPTENFADEIEKANLFLQDLKKIGQNPVNDFSEEIFKGDLDWELPKLAPAMAGLKNSSDSLLIDIRKIAPFISPKHCQRIINTIFETAKLNNYGLYLRNSLNSSNEFYHLQSFEHLITFVFSNSEVRSASHKHLLDILQLQELPQKIKLNICDKLLDYCGRFGIEKESAFYKDVIIQQAVCNADMTENSFYQSIDEIFEKLKTHLENYPSLIKDIVKTAVFIDPKLYETYISKVFQTIESADFDNFEDLISYFFSDAEIRDPSHDYLITILKDNTISKEQKFQLCEKLKDSQSTLKIDEDSPLMREITIQAVLSCPTFVFGTFSNPYEVYDLLKQSLDLELINNIFGIADFIDSTFHEAYLAIILQMIQTGDFNKEDETLSQKVLKIFNTVFSDAQIRNATHDQFLRGIENSNFSPQLILSLCHTITDFQHLLQIDEDSPLFIAMLARQIACNPDAQHTFNNPFYLYEKIKNQLTNESKGVLDIKIAPEIIAGKNVQWLLPDPAQQKTIIHTRACLSQTLSKDTLKELFEKLKERINTLSPEDQAIALKDLNEMREGDFELIDELCASLLNDSYILKTCHLPINVEDSITLDQFYFFNCLQYFQDNWGKPASEPDRKRILTQGEDLLVKFSLSVQNCPIGRYDRIVEFYHCLPLAYQLSEKSNRSIDKGKHVVKMMVQNFFEETINSNSLLQQMTEQENLSQASHVALYLKNRLKDQIFYSTHQLKFDLHTEIFTKTLLDKDIQELLSIFFKHCSLQLTVQRLIQQSERLLSSNNYEGILALLEKNQSPIDYPLNFVINEDDEPTALTENSALTLLKEAGYAKFVD